MGTAGSLTLSLQVLRRAVNLSGFIRPAWHWLKRPVIALSIITNGFSSEAHRCLIGTQRKLSLSRLVHRQKKMSQVSAVIAA